MTTTLQSYKTVDWSYPTSENAKRFGHPEGCWTVSRSMPQKDARGCDCYLSKAVAAFTGFADAVNYADAMTESYFLNRRPETFYPHLAKTA